VHFFRYQVNAFSKAYGRVAGVLFLLLVSSLGLPCAIAARAQAAVDPQPDERFKTDLLVVIGHPDDETFIAGYLARAGFDQHKRISVIICTASEAGGNVFGPESGNSLGYVQMIEGKRAFASLGIENVWFLTGRDTPGQNVLWSLGNWDHGRVLGQVTRLIRLTRPEVVLTELPLPVAGENHGDHQAAGVIATEAFDLAGDRTAFPEQLASAHELRGVGNLTEGLQPWQAKKIYYFTDAFDNISQYYDDPKDISPFRPNLLAGVGPEYQNAEHSPSKDMSYAQLSAIESSFYLTQGGIGDNAVAALAKKDFQPYAHPVRLIFGKNAQGGADITADVFDGLGHGDLAYVPVPGYAANGGAANPDRTPSFTIAGPWEFYSYFWKAHSLERIGRLLPTPELAIGTGATLKLPMTIVNPSDAAVVVTVRSQLPAGWSERGPEKLLHVDPGGSVRFQPLLTAPDLKSPQWQELRWNAYVDGKSIGEILIRVLSGKNGGLPQ
jgi:LmbE family N-acetylglucosaminyl deacetylase